MPSSTRADQAARVGRHQVRAEGRKKAFEAREAREAAVEAAKPKKSKKEKE